MSLPDRVVKRPVATITILFIVLVIGAVSLWQTPLDLLPEIKPPYLAVVTAFPGGSPQETLKLVTEPIESHLSAIGGLRNIQSLSQENISLVALEFRWGADLKHLREEIGARLDLLTLPEGVQRPIIIEFDPTLLPIMQVMVSSDLEAVELSEWLENMAKPRLETISGVASVQVLGTAKRDFFVRLLPEKTREKEVSFEQAANILRASLVDLPGGIVELDSRQMRIRIIGRPFSFSNLSNLVIGFQVDEGALEKILGQSININLNQMLSESLPEVDKIDIPMRPVYLKDVVRNVKVDEEAGRIIIHPGKTLLESIGLSLEQLAALLPEEWAAEIEGEAIVIPLPPDTEINWEAIRNTYLLSVPDFKAWSDRLQKEVGGELDKASQRLEKSLVDMAMAMILSSAGPGGGLALPEDEFPLIPITLGSIAEITEDLHPSASLNRFNRQPSVGFALQKEGEANTVVVARQVRRALEELATEFAAQGGVMHFNYTFDQAAEIEIALADLARDLLLGSLLAVAVLLLFLRNWRTILIIGLTIPVALLAAFALLYFARLTINLMTLGGLALAAGMLVDNSIVVSENIYRHLQLGASPAEAAVRGSKEVAGAILASTLTTVCVFFPVVFLSGLAGELFRDFALTVSCALLASLAIALTIIPLLAVRFLKSGENHRFGRGRGRAGGRARFDYRALLEAVLRKPWLTVGVGAACLVLGAALIPILGTNLFPVTEDSSFAIEVILPPGTPLDETDAFTAKLEQIVAAQEEIASCSARVGESQMFGMPLESGVSNQARITVKVDPAFTAHIDEIMEAIRRQAGLLPGEAEIHFSRQSLLEASGLDVRLEILVQGAELEKIKEISARVVERLEALPDLSDVRASTEDSRPEIHIQIDHFEALRRGVTVYQVAMMLHQALEGISVARLETAEGIYDLVLGYKRSEIENLDDLKNIGFYTAAGSFVRLGDVAEFTESLGPLNIPRENQQVIGRVQAQVRGQDLGGATRAALAALEDIELPPGYSIREAASSQMQDIYDELYLVLAVAAVLVYLVMAAQFESFLHPFIIICSLPLVLVGAVPALLVTGNSLSIPAMIGGVVLAGIIVNDGIIMVDFINQLRFVHGLPLREAIIEGAAARLRPILMTTITTVLGLVPLALALGEGSRLQAPMALVVIGGEISGTLLLLVVIPAIYNLVNRRKA